MLIAKLNNFYPMPNTNYSAAEAFDWLSDLTPAYAAQESWENQGYTTQETVHYFYQSRGPFYIACGAGLLADHVRRFRFSPELIQRLGRVTDAMGRSVFQESFLNHLQRLRLRVQVNVPPEGMLMFANEPILIAHGPRDQLQLLDSAFRRLLWASTHWATEAALERWENGELEEEDAPAIPTFQANPEGWRLRATYIGGGELSTLKPETLRAIAPNEGPGLIEAAPGDALVQIRRMFQQQQALGDLWLSDSVEEKLSVSRKKTQMRTLWQSEPLTFNMTRFQNLYLPVLIKGHPVQPPTRLGYLRQRMLKHLRAFSEIELEKYPLGWGEL